MLKKFLIVLGVLIVLLVLVGLVLPKHFESKHSIVVKAEPAKVHALVGDLKRWDEWGPWMEEDPTIVTTFGNATTGVGASQAWTGESGSGRLQFTRSDPATGVEFDMVFIEDGQEMPASGWIRYAPAAGGTQVEWGMKGTMNVPIVGGYFAACSDLMLGGMFQRGLDKLKLRVEAQ